MKVLVEKHNDKKVYKVECWNCGSILEYTDNDIEIDERDGKHIICPVCDSYTTHSEKNIEDYNDTEEIKDGLKSWSLKPFDKFLYRSTKKGVWEIGFFGYRVVSEFGDPDYNWDYFTIGGFDFGTEVLPYNDETKHLHRTMEPRVGNWALIPTILE